MWIKYLVGLKISLSARMTMSLQSANTNGPCRSACVRACVRVCIGVSVEICMYARGGGFWLLGNHIGLPSLPICHDNCDDSQNQDGRPNRHADDNRPTVCEKRNKGQF